LACASDAPAVITRRERNRSLSQRRLEAWPWPMMVKSCAKQNATSIRKGRRLLIRRQSGVTDATQKCMPNGHDMIATTVMCR
jgi:hypothetical protein